MYRKKLFTALLVVSLIMITGCSKDEAPPVTVTTAAVTDITSISATCGGTVDIAGNATVSARGVCWAISHNPTNSGNKTTDGTGSGTFSSSLAGLISGTTYYVRAYATVGNSSYYGEEVTLTTLGETEMIQNGDFSLPADGKKYLRIDSIPNWKTDETGDDKNGREFDPWRTDDGCAYTDDYSKSIYQVIGKVPATATDYAISFDHNFIWTDWGDYETTVCVIFSAYSGSDPTTRVGIDTTKILWPIFPGWGDNWGNKTASFSLPAGSTHAGENLVFELDILPYPSMEYGSPNLWFNWDNVSVKQSSGK
jgi:hypothetical protein